MSYFFTQHTSCQLRCTSLRFTAGPRRARHRLVFSSAPAPLTLPKLQNLCQRQWHRGQLFFHSLTQMTKFTVSGFRPNSPFGLTPLSQRSRPSRTVRLHCPSARREVTSSPLVHFRFAPTWVEECGLCGTFFCQASPQLAWRDAGAILMADPRVVENRSKSPPPFFGFRGSTSGHLLYDLR